MGTKTGAGRPPPLWFIRLAVIGLEPSELYTTAEIALLAERSPQSVRTVLVARLGEPEHVAVQGSLNLHSAWRGRDLIDLGEARVSLTKEDAVESYLQVPMKLRREFDALRRAFGLAKK